MKVGPVTPDPKQKRKQRPDWIFTVKDGHRVQVHRFQYGQLEKALNEQAKMSEWNDE